MQFIDEALLQSSIVYASARTVNAAISLLQSAEVGIGIASIQPAQLLDPVNDLAEYMADAMRLAIGSLFLQRILYTISSGLFFSSLFTLAVIGYFICEWRGYYASLRHKILASLILVRFLVPAVVLATGLTSQAFLDVEIDQQSESVSNKATTLNNTASATSAISSELTTQINAEKQTLLDNIELLNSQQITIHQQTTDIRTHINQLDQEIDRIQAGRSLSEKLTFTELTETKPLLTKKQQLNAQLTALTSQQRQLNQQKDQLNSALQNINKQLSGDSSSAIRQVVDTVSNGINNIVVAMEDLFIDFLNVLSLLILKLLLLPLIFWYLFNKAFKTIWQRDIKQLLGELTNKAVVK
ncbi:hypothetical protein [Pseudoalteromonas mariniglutinosa]